MTDLTQDWNKGTLNKGWYYVECNNEIYPDYYCGYFVQTGDKPDLKVLSEVPDYTAWQNMWNTADMEHKANNKLLEEVERLEKENKELKEKINDKNYRK